MAPAWCARPSPIGTPSSSVHTPIVACSSARHIRMKPLVMQLRRSAAGCEPARLQDGGEHHGVAQHAVIELHGERVLEQVEIPGRGFAEAARHEGAVDQRPGVVAEPCVDSGDKSARQDLEIDQREHHAGDPRRRGRARSRRSFAFTPEVEDEPQRVAEDGDGDAEMRRQPVLAHIDTGDEAALHHVPAERALQPAEHEQSEQPRQQCARYVAGEPEGEEGHKEGDADQAAEEAMSPFPPIDGLELIEAHAALLSSRYSGIFW